LKLEIHSQASKNYNRKAEGLVKLLQPIPDNYRHKGGRPNPNIHTVHQFTPENIGEMEFGWRDFTGKVVAKAFDDGGQMLGLFDGDHADLVRLTEGMQKSIAPHSVVSLQALHDLIFEWVKLKHQGSSTPTMTEYVLSECEKLIKEVEIWIPISLLYIQSPFSFGKVSFRAITKDMMDEWEKRALSKASDVAEEESIRKGFERYRKEFQGLAAAIIKVEAETEQAHEIAFEEIDRTMSILRFFSAANYHPAKICYSAPLGRQHRDSYTYLTVTEGRFVGHRAGLVDRSRPYWNLGHQDLNTWAPELAVLDKLLNREALTDFQEAVLDALILYSRSSLARQVSEKLIYILIALESVLLKDQGEFIQDAVSLRMAYMQDVPVEKRRAIIANVKTVYKLRSSFIHHGHNIGIDDTKLLTEFMTNAILSLGALIPLAASEITKEEFFNRLEDRRLAS
jgi:hypothetical protein